MNTRYRLSQLLAVLTIAGLPNFNATAQGVQPASPGGGRVFNVKDFGATGDGSTLDTAAIARAIEAAAMAGGGTVFFPAGTYRTGTFQLRSNITLDLDSGAVIQGSKNLDDYSSSQSVGLGHVYGTDSSGEGNKAGIIFARNVENVSIVGRGTIDGSGDEFFDFTRPHYSMDFEPAVTRQHDLFTNAVKQTGDGPIEFKPDGRPGTMIICFDCRNVVVRDVTLRNAPNWTMHFNTTERAVVSGIHIVNNPLLPNNDGFDCFGCKEVHVSDCDIRTGDDDFAIVNSSDFSIENCSLTSRSSGIRLEATQNSTFENLTVHANRGIGIYERGAGNTHHLMFSNLVIDTQLFTGHWWGKGEPIYVVAAKPASPGVGEVSDVHFANISGEVESSTVLDGSPDAPLRNISFNDVRFVMRVTRKAVSDAVGGNFDFRWTAISLNNAVFQHDIPGIYARYVEELHLHGVEVRWRGQIPSFFSSAIEVEDFRNLDIDGFRGREAREASAAALVLKNGDGVSIRNCTAAAGTRWFLDAQKVSGKRLLLGNDLAGAAAVYRQATLGFTMRANSLPPSSHKQRAAKPE